jgi:uncharacterized membrane protein
MNLRFPLPAIAAVVLSGASTFAQTISDVSAVRNYTFESFSVPLPLTVVTGATGINNRGAVVGSYTVPDKTVGFKRDANGVFEFPMQGATNMRPSYARGINDSGDIVGYAYDGTKYFGFLLTVQGKYSIIDAAPNLGLPPKAFTYITGLNNLGDFVGYVSCYSSGCDSKTHGFANIAGSLTLVDVGDMDFADVDVTFPQAIAWDGTIVGCYQDQNLRQHGFLRGPKGEFLRFEVAGGDNTCATGVNNEAHTIVGTFHGSDYKDHSFVYDYAADFASSLQQGNSSIRMIRPQTLEFPGVGTAFLSGINAKGVVVGTFIPSEGYTFSFIARPE